VIFGRQQFEDLKPKNPCFSKEIGYGNSVQEELD